MSKFWSFGVENSVGNLCFNSPDSDVNVLSFENLAELEQQLVEITTRTDLKALLFTSGKVRIFIVGADIKDIENITSAKDAFEKAQLGKAIFKKIESLRIPTVCVINGACLGGGAELALACRSRVASFSPQIKIGLPEVNLGVLPGFGGSIRLPRLLGLIRALPLLLTGRLVGFQEAFKIGLLDRLFPEAVLLREAQAFALKLADGQAPRKIRKKNFMTIFMEHTPPGRAWVLSQATKDVLEKTGGAYPAPLEIIKLLRSTHGRASERDYQAESDHFSRLAVTQVSKNLIKIFFLNEKYKKYHWTQTVCKEDGIRKCGIVGAGVMGGGIAQLISSRDIPVRVKDLNEKALSGALA
ncbi:MAG: hypothetical protein COT00_02150 [Candidatus Omnitrophica bacterium CG07_land_8_20_14_0_80_50_8]|nr:MAG: hypothetical protein COT00_02150 [Candidatus Omnitrophica bacterium CG07_land_8_20_14_0_80_50_8]